ncbi:MAG: hypothetical protein ACP5D2_01085 [Candidatus Nanoarchaeia archaeon]
MIKIILSILIILTAIPIGIFLSHLTKDEKHIYKKYFPPLLWILAILAAIFFTLNIIYALILSFLFLLILVWLKIESIESKFRKNKIETIKLVYDFLFPIGISLFIAGLIKQKTYGFELVYAGIFILIISVIFRAKYVKKQI